ncbi:cytochrome c-type biogenesis protein CcmH [Devosia lucknowensis]|uniref:Cytochrome c-type biogenesis protein n=1 Tax=Devosia lucknowensis TaxID=1096929 RepID=A0A1Y6EF19_9HYPH|nr:cytochrome c-type biogenesis protein [Devosia lucknowensis]SMQ61184.1 cytochrome c-type biogenesis protein CcmH [Devosia lucknowensis]
MTRLRPLILCVLLLLSPVALAVGPDEVLPDAALEQRARDISAGLRCLVCQNQSIDDSDAELARDLRILVRERLVAGDSNAEVEQYLVDRYGEYVLLNPRLNSHTVLLWVAAPALLILGLVALFVARRRSAGTNVSTGLSSEEQAALDTLESGRPRD